MCLTFHYSVFWIIYSCFQVGHFYWPTHTTKYRQMLPLPRTTDGNLFYKMCHKNVIIDCMFIGLLLSPRFLTRTFPHSCGTTAFVGVDWALPLFFLARPFFYARFWQTWVRLDWDPHTYTWKKKLHIYI